MRTVTFGVASSLDGYLARGNHDVDWLRWSDEVGAISAAYWETVDTVVMGRKTFERAPRGGYPGKQNYLCSRSLKRSPDEDVELVGGDAALFVRQLKARRGKGICIMGGGELANSLFQAGLIDEVGINLHPVLLGSGIPLFHALSRQLDLELLDCKLLENGCVYLRYRVGQKRARRS